MRLNVFTLLSLLLSSVLVCSSAEQCGTEAGGGGLISDGVEDVDAGVGDIGSTISRTQFNNMLKHRNDNACPAKGFYTYDAFLTAAKAFPAFGSTGDLATRKKEIAAFLAQTSHETTGGWASAPDGPYAWGYCFVNEKNPPSKYCDPKYPCPKSYHGRGPMQLSWNYNYQKAGRAIGADLINHPELVSSNIVISFKTALWFWMTPQAPKPSCHDVITGRWKPTAADRAAGRVPGYGMITNIINGGIECGKGRNPQVEDRIGFYRRYCQIYGINPGSNLDCYNQKPFGSRLAEDVAKLLEDLVEVM